MLKSKKYWLIFLCTLMGVASGFLYCVLAIPVYQVSGSVGIMRPTLPPVSNFMPETQNRWVWIRDGLSMKDMLLQETLLYEFIQTSSEVKKRLDIFASEYPNMKREDIIANYINKLKKSIKIQYTGGDANVFIFSVTDSNPELAKVIVNLLMTNLKKLYEETMFIRNNVSLNALYLKTNELKNEIRKNPDSSAEAFLQSKLNAAYEAGSKLYVENIFQNIQSQTLIKTIDKPYTPTHPIWPRWDLVIFFTTVAGLLAGVLIYYIVSRQHE